MWLYEVPLFSDASRGRSGGSCHLITFYSRCSFRPICPFSLHLPATAISTCRRVTQQGLGINPSRCWHAGKVPFGNNRNIWPFQYMGERSTYFIFFSFCVCRPLTGVRTVYLLIYWIIILKKKVVKPRKWIEFAAKMSWPQSRHQRHVHIFLKGSEGKLKDSRKHVVLLPSSPVLIFADDFSDVSGKYQFAHTLAKRALKLGSRY